MLTIHKNIFLSSYILNIAMLIPLTPNLFNENVVVVSLLHFDDLLTKRYALNLFKVKKIYEYG